MELIDTHVHLLQPDRFSYPWCADVSALRRAFHLADFRAAAADAPAGVHVSAVVCMEADVPAAQQFAEATFFAQLAASDRGQPRVSALVAAAHPESPDFPAQLERLATLPAVRGLRRVLHTQAPDFALSPIVAAHLRRLPAYRWPFELCARPHLLPHVAELVRRCPETQFVLDHCGVPDVAAGTLDPWRRHVRELAALPNLLCKLSGLSGLAEPDRPLTPQVQPFLDHCYECFGPSRLLWGSDWPVCTLAGHDLAAWIATTVDWLSGHPLAEQTSIASANARRLYRLD